MKITKFITLTSVTMLLLISCQEEEIFMNDSMAELKTKAPTFKDLGNTVRSISVKTDADNFRKSTETYNVALYKAEYITTGDNDEMGNTVFFSNVGNKQLGADFAPGLSLDGTDNISYYVDDNRPSADLLVPITNNAIDRAMSTWDGVTCSELGMFEVPYDGRATGFISALIGFGGSFNYAADVTHAGWMPPLFFDFLAPGGSNFILGVTFTLIFTDGSGNPVDTDNNGKIDVAFREIYYNDNFTWNDGGTFDVETIALHEAGHGLSQGHFGKAFRSGGNGKLHFSPRAVMNAAYTGVQTSINETDNAGHCSNWASWPSH